jgi:hypothetical protein
MNEHNQIGAHDGDVNADSLRECVRRVYADRSVKKAERRLFGDLIAELQIQGYRSNVDIERMLVRTKDAVERYEKDPKAPPPPLSDVGILRAAMRLADGNISVNENGFDAEALRVLQKYAKYVRPEDRDC